MFFESEFTTTLESTEYYRKRYENDERVTIKANSDGTITIISNDLLSINPSSTFDGTITLSVIEGATTFKYEIISTKRSWYVQNNILSESEYSRNGLSWNLYGNGFSIFVYFEGLSKPSKEGLITSFSSL